MKFRTELQPVLADVNIDFSSRLLMLGSCFSDNIGARLLDSLFDVTINPTGTLYNPLSILHAVELMCSDRLFTERDLISHDGLYHSFDHHSRFSRPDVEATLSAINGELARARRLLPQLSHAIITLGTTHIFELPGEDGAAPRVVANCHKLPAARFTERTLTADESTQALLRIIELLRCASPDVTIIFTVSPIRHLRSGLEGNSLSKATLRVAIDSALRQAPCPRRLHYFPAYEIMLDDLRDYRFYEADMKHPSAVAVDYIFSLFLDAATTPSTRAEVTTAQRLAQRLKHRASPFVTKEGEHFAAETRHLVEQFIATHPHLPASTISRLKQSYQ